MSSSNSLIEVIQESGLSPIHKSHFTGLVKRAQDWEKEHSSVKKLIEKVANQQNISDIVLSNEEVKIYTVYGNRDWDIKFPYRVIFLNKKGNWERCSTVSPNLDLAYLVYLEKKHIGENSQFTNFAMKMLGIDIDSIIESVK